MKSPLISIIVPQMSSNVRECASLIRTIKAADCPLTVFNITPLGLFNKLYKRSFLQSIP